VSGQRRKYVAPRPRNRFERVQVGMRCEGGPFVRDPDHLMPLDPKPHEPHQIAAGDYALLGACNLIWCEPYARLRGFVRLPTPPPRQRPFTFRKRVSHDVRARQVGQD